MNEKRYRLLHKKDGSYVLQEGIDAPYLDGNVIRYKPIWEDLQTVEEEKGVKNE